jgi:acetylornithine deacetylase/succinyl-diaminopimelate desuccinylase family protein
MAHSSSKDEDIKTLFRNIDEEGLIIFLQEMVCTNSENPPGNEDKVARLIAKELESFGCEVELSYVETDRPNVIGQMRGRTDEMLLFHGHTDTVKVGNLQKWTNLPLAGIIDNGRLYGRGACDMKAGMAAMIFAMKALKKSGFPLQRGMMFSGVIDEEVTFKGIHALLSQGKLTKCTQAIVGEPTDLTLCICQKGAIEYTVETFGRYAHSGMAFNGDNAIFHMMKIVTALGQYGVELSLSDDPFLRYPTVNVGTIEGGTGVTFVPDRCVMEFDRQTLPGEEPEEVHRAVERLIAETAKATGFKVELTRNQQFSAWKIDPGDPLVRMVQDASVRALDKDISLAGFYAYSEADLLARQGISSVILGPGRIDEAHCPDEYVLVEQVIQAARLYAVLAYQFSVGQS